MFADHNERPARARYSVDIYSQNSNSWQQKEILPWQIHLIRGYHPHISHSYTGFLVNESLYWKTWYINNDKEIHAILRFDTLNEKFDVILSPDNEHDYDLVVFKGHLCLVEYDKLGHIDMWTRAVGKNQNWIKFMKLPPCENVSPYVRLALICSMKEDEILASIRQLFISLHSRRKKKFLWYSPEAKTYKKIHICNTMKHFNKEIKEITYTDSFVSP
ncbi:hypothetical protein LWI29_017539 [Acer saccharum]|uniref:F-box associated beta-propeller type 3 domain-containing protein n=1 Tax=Acer saccharum TaxID=4024 RepID=A0AA39TQV2_ACESA|nr:hypothetical protein LWI29_017539 [Acer saccharum]